MTSSLTIVFGEIGCEENIILLYYWYILLYFILDMLFIRNTQQKEKVPHYAKTS